MFTTSVRTTAVAPTLDLLFDYLFLKGSDASSLSSLSYLDAY
jgi:hypothetical protein